MENSNATITLVDVWRSFPIIQSFLTLSEKVKFSNTCRLMKQLTENSINWPSLEITNQGNG